jgi:hypothetical protein
MQLSFGQILSEIPPHYVESNAESFHAQEKMMTLILEDACVGLSPAGKLEMETRSQSWPHSDPSVSHGILRRNCRRRE